MSDCCCSPQGPSFGAFPPLSNAFFVDAGTSTPPASQTGSILSPFSTVTAAVARVPNGQIGSLLVMGGYDYTGEAAIDQGTRRLTIAGWAYGTTPNTQQRPLLPAFNGAGGELAIADCQIVSVGATTPLVGLQLFRSRVAGAIHVTTNLNMQTSGQGGAVTIDGTGGGGKVTLLDCGLNGLWTITGGGSGNDNAPQCDEQSFSSLLFNGVRRADANPDWNVRHQLFAHIQDANRTITSIYYGLAVSTGTLTAARTVTVTQDATLPVGAGFRVDRYDASVNTLNVNGSVGGAVALTNAALTRSQFNLLNNAGPTLAFSFLRRLAAA